MQRVVYLSEGRLVTLSGYVTAWKNALAAPPNATFERGFNWYPEKRDAVLREFRRGLHDRINRRVPGFSGALRPKSDRGRKWQYEWQIETYRAAQQLNHPRLIIHWLPPWLKQRFQHRLHDPSDY